MKIDMIIFLVNMKINASQWNYFWSLTLGVPWYHCTKQAQENTTVLTLSSVKLILIGKVENYMYIQYGTS